MSHKQLRQEAGENHKAKLHRMLGGHVDMADKKSDERMVKSAIAQHEKHDHAGEKETKLKLARGGAADEEGKGKTRLDRPGRARGGKAPKHGAHVNVIVAPQGPGAAPAAPPMMHPPMPMPPVGPPPGGPPPGMGGPPGGMPGGPPIGAMAPHPPMMMPPGAAGMMPPRKRGGKVDTKYPIDDGAHGGEGRLEKIAAYGKNADKGEGERRRGGRS